MIDPRSATLSKHRAVEQQFWILKDHADLARQ